MKDLEAELQRRKAQHLYRRRRIADTPQQVEMVVDGRDVISFCSNDYLGLANHPRVKQAFIEGANRYGVGSGAAHLINGHSRAHHELELALAEFTGHQRALLFSTGYMANLGVAQAFTGRGDTVLEDRLNHASLIDAGLISGARLMRYRHNDVTDLEHKLAGRNSGEKLVMTDAVFSMDGDVADLASIMRLCRQHDAMLLADDAHGFGVLGEDGRGSLSQQQCEPDQNTVYMATLGKAAGTAGAFVAGSEAVIETLIQQARTGIYTTAQPPALAAATLQSLELIRQGELRRRLHDNIAYFRQCMREAGLATGSSHTAIQPVLTGDTLEALRLADALLERGLLVIAIRPPTVPEGTARLRITLSAGHRHAHIDRLVDALAEVRGA